MTSNKAGVAKRRTSTLVLGLPGLVLLVIVSVVVAVVIAFEVARATGCRSNCNDAVVTASVVAMPWILGLIFVATAVLFVIVALRAPARWYRPIVAGFIAVAAYAIVTVIVLRASIP